MMAKLLPKVVLSRRTAEIASCTDEEFFTRESFQTYLNQTLKAVVSATKAGTIRLAVTADDDGSTGATNGEMVLLNVLSPFVKAQKSRQDKLYTIIGMLTHECGHILFSDWDASADLQRGIEGGVFPGYPDIEDALKDPDFREYFSLQARWIDNLLEDDHIEQRIHDTFAGLPSVCLRYTREEAATLVMKDLMERYPEYGKLRRVMMMLLLQVGKSRKLGNLRKKYPREYAQVGDVYEEALRHMRKNTKQRAWSHSSIRMENLKAVISAVFPLLMEDYRDRLEDLKEKPPEEGGESPPSGPEGSPGGSGSGTPGGSGGGEGKETGREKGRDPDPVPEEELLQSLLSQVRQEQDDLAEKTGKFEQELSGTGQSDLFIGEHRASGSEIPDADDPEKMAKAELELSRIREEEGELEELDRRLVIERMETEPSDIPLYQDMLRNVMPVIKRTVRMLEPVLRDRQLEGRLAGQLYGKRMDMRQVFREDGRIYSRDLVPDGAPKVAFGIRIDESGSMSGASIKAARQAAVALEAILRELKIPFCIYGDTADTGWEDGDVLICKYAEFDAYDDKDRFRLARIRERYNNHDAIAVRVVANALKKRPEPQKVLIVISDGMPAASGFSGDAACRQTAETVAGIEKTGIHVFAAAISGCYEEIEGIYGKHRVMDIRDLDMLPVSLTKLIKKYVTRRV